MGARVRRSRGQRAGRAGILVAALLAVAGLLIALAAHRDAGRTNPDSAIFVTVPALPPAAGGAAVPGSAGVDPGAATTDPPAVPDGAGAGAGASWPAPPEDPTGAVDAALARAATAGVSVGVVVLDRTTGAVLVARDADVPYPALSLLKVMIAADVLTTGWPVAAPPPVGSEGPAGTAGPGEPTASGDPAAPADPAAIDARLTRMITTSDDVIAGDLYEASGGDAMVQRVAQRYGMTGTGPTPDGTYWGNVQVTAADLAALLSGVLSDPATAAVIGPAMTATTAIAADGVDQRFGMRTVPGAGSKQGWGCCLSGIAGIHSMGFTDDRIVVVLSGVQPDDESLGEQDGLALQADPGARAGFTAVDDVVRAALAGPAG